MDFSHNFALLTSEQLRHQFYQNLLETLGNPPNLASLAGSRPGSVLHSLRATKFFLLSPQALRLNSARPVTCPSRPLELPPGASPLQGVSSPPRAAPPLSCTRREGNSFRSPPRPQGLRNSSNLAASARCLLKASFTQHSAKADARLLLPPLTLLPQLRILERILLSQGFCLQIPT